MRRLVVGVIVGVLCMVMAAGTAGAVHIHPAIPDYESPVRSGRVDLIVIHTAETPETSNADRNVCAYLARARSVSVHWCVDNDSATPSVPENRVAWTASHRFVNNRALQFELAGYAGQSRAEWFDPYSRATVRNTAAIAARMVREHGIPLRKLTTAEMCSGARGFIGHVDVRGPCAANRDGHWDPGPNFPWDTFLADVGGFLGQAPPAAAPVPLPPGHLTQPSGGRNLTSVPTANIQRVVGVWADGIYGPQTTAAVMAWQARLGIPADGVWGPQTQTHTARFLAWIAPAPPARPTLRVGSRGSSVAELQRHLNRYGQGLVVDGVYGRATERAVRNVQRWHQIAVDGVAGPQTWSVL